MPQPPAMDRPEACANLFLTFLVESASIIVNASILYETVTRGAEIIITMSSEACGIILDLIVLFIMFILTWSVNRR